MKESNPKQIKLKIRRKRIKKSNPKSRTQKVEPKKSNPKNNQKFLDHQNGRRNNTFVPAFEHVVGRFVVSSRMGSDYSR